MGEINIWQEYETEKKKINIEKDYEEEIKNIIERLRA